MHIDPALGKRCLIHLRLVSSQISLCITHRLIRDDTLRIDLIFVWKRFLKTKNSNKQIVSSLRYAASIFIIFFLSGEGMQVMQLREMLGDVKVGT